MKLFLVLTILATLAIIYTANARPTSDEEWEGYKKKFDKTYKTPEDEQEHRNAYTKTVQWINEHNKRYDEGKESYSLGINQFTDKTDAEKKATEDCLAEREKQYQKDGIRIIGGC